MPDSQDPARTPPDAVFHLTPEQRAEVRPGFDVAALERLLAAAPPEARQWLLEGFQGGAPNSFGPYVVRMEDPALQELLEEVWAPMWERYPELMADDMKEYPGREAAIRRSQTEPKDPCDPTP